MTSNKLENCCIWLVDSVESMMMHGLANPKTEDKVGPISTRASSAQPGSVL
jgi:hypothetical protein